MSFGGSMKRLFCFFLLSCMVFLLIAEKPDSLISVLQTAKGKNKVDILNKLSYNYRASDVEKSLQHAQQALELGKELKYNSGIAKSYYRIGYTYYLIREIDKAFENFEKAKLFYEISGELRYLGLSLEFMANCNIRTDDFISAKDYMDQAIEIYKKIDAKKDIARVYSNSTKVLTRLGNLDLALQNLYNALEIKQELADMEDENDQLNIANTLTNIGTTLLKTKDFERALEYLFKAKSINDTYGNEDQNIYSSIGIAYNQMQQYKKSLEYHQLALKLSREKNDLNMIAQELNNIGYVYDLQKDWNTCLQYYIESYQMKKQVNDIYGIANSAKNVGSIYLEIGNLTKAKEYIDESMRLAQKNKFVEIIRDNHYLYSRLYEKQNKFSLALLNERKYSSFQDSIFTQSMQDKIAELETKYNLREQQRQNELLQRDNVILMLRSEKENLAKLRSYLIILVSLLILIYLIDLILRKHYKEKILSKIKTDLEAKVRERTQELERINIDLQQQVQIREKAEQMIKDSLAEKVVMLREIHHRVKNNMQIISSIINLQLEKDEINAETENLLSNIQNRIYSMSLIHEKLYMESNLANIDFEDYTKGLVSYLLSNYQENSSYITPKINIKEIQLNVTAGIPCGLLINEVVTNSVKYAFDKNEQGEIFIEMNKMKDGSIEMRIGNNGKSFEFDKIKNENTIGLRLIELLAKQLGSKLEFDNSNGVEYKIKIKRSNGER